MVTRFIVENFKSLKDRTEINFVSPFSHASGFKDNTLYSFYDNVKKCVLESLILFGANGSGKSNIKLKALNISLISFIQGIQK